MTNNCVLQTSDSDVSTTAPVGTIVPGLTDSAYYDYNAVNQLTGYQNLNGVKESFTYDVNGLRNSKTYAGQTTKFYYDGDNVADETKNGSLSAVNYYGAGGQIEKRENYSGTTATAGYFITDGHGDTIALRDASNQELATYKYDIYGKEKKAIGNFDNPFRYTGQYYDSESGMYYLRARFYDPDLKRFISEDTHWNTGNCIYGDNNTRIPSVSAIMQSGNLYGYCAGDPVNSIDPSGQTYIIAWSYSKSDLAAYTDSKGQVDWGSFTKENSFARAAYTRRQELIDMGISAKDIDVQRIDNEQDMKDTWKMWSSYSLVEGFDMFSHGSANGPIVAGGGGSFLSNATQLNWGESWRSINGKAVVTQPYAVFHGCNTANGSFAQSFANTQQVTTYAQEGNASFSSNPTIHIPIKDGARKGKVYLYCFEDNKIRNKNNWGKKFTPQGK